MRGNFSYQRRKKYSLTTHPFPAFFHHYTGLYKFYYKPSFVKLRVRVQASHIYLIFLIIIFEFMFAFVMLNHIL